MTRTTDLVIFSITCFYFLAVLCAASVQNSNHFNLNEPKYPTVDITQGTLQGLVRKTSNGKRFYSFKGVPYAEPPVGELRFRDPLPVVPWLGVRNAFEDGSPCTQPNFLGGIRGEEDCLYLNVYTPSLSKDELKKYPVMIYIHGGGWLFGRGTELEIKPNIFLESDIVVVTINYRLGIFGLLSLDIPEVPGNALFKDQLLSIKWVKENIINFNGDPNNVTLHGASSGSASIEFHLLNSHSKGLFQRVSMQSGATLSSWARPRSQQTAIKSLADVIGVSNQPYEVLQKLMKMTTWEIFEAVQQSMFADSEFLKDGLVFTQFSPVLEKTFNNVSNFLTRDPLEYYITGDYLKVPILNTFCKDEGDIYPLFYGEDLVTEMLNRNYADFMGFMNITDKDAVNKRLTELYSSMNINETKQMHEFLSDLMFMSGIYQNIKYISKDKTNAHYSYMFSYVGNLSFELPDGTIVNTGGASHVMDMYYLMFTEDDELNETDLKMKEYMASIHTNFIKYGNPDPNGDFQWKPITDDSFYILNISKNEVNLMVPFPFKERMEYWDTLFH